MQPPQVNLQPGSSNTAAVQQLQNWLVANGFMSQAQVNTGYGTYGPQTTQAVIKAQQQLGVDNSSGPGYWGPKTIAAVTKVSSPSTPAQTAPTGPQIGSYKGTPIYGGTDAQVSAQISAVDAGKNGTTTGTSTPAQPKTQADIDAQIKAQNAAVAAHPTFAGNSADSINYATSTGDYSQLLNAQGQPFSSADQASALSDATAAVSPYYQAEQTKDTQDTQAALQSKTDAYNKYLSDQATQFQADKTTQDQTAANNGVLFSGARAQKLQALGDAYTKNNAYQKNAYGADIANTARDFGYKYGDTAANGLSSYYSLGGNTYNPNVAKGGVGSSGLSSIYNANQGFQGTEINAAKTAAQQRAAALLANKGNKLVASGYTNPL